MRATLSLFAILRCAVAVLLVFFACASAQADVAVPRLAARVTDLTSTLDATQRSALEDKLTAFEKAKGSQIAVLIVPTTEPETTEDRKSVVQGKRVAVRVNTGRR